MVIANENEIATAFCEYFPSVIRIEGPEDFDNLPQKSKLAQTEAVKFEVSDTHY
jgi:hypothetical protein